MRLVIKHNLQQGSKPGQFSYRATYYLRTLPQAVVPYLQMSERWLEEHGFAIGAGVRVVVEHGRSS